MYNKYKIKFVPEIPYEVDHDIINHVSYIKVVPDYCNTTLIIFLYKFLCELFTSR